MLDWINDNLGTILSVGVVVFFVLGAGLVWMAIQDRRSRQSQNYDTQFILAGFGRAEEPAQGVEGTMFSWKSWTTATMPRYSDVPAVTRVQEPGRHRSLVSADDTEIIEVVEGQEEYEGRHRLPERATAAYVKAIMTSTQALPMVPARRLSPGWRAAVPA